MNFMGGSSNRTGGFPADPTGKSMSKRGGGINDLIPKGYRKGQIQNFTPEMMDLFQQLLGMIGPESDLARLAGGDQSKFAEIEAPAHRQFNELMGGLASRFSAGGLGGRHGSGFQNARTAASSNFAQDLASRRHELSRQAILDLMGIGQMLLGQRPTEQFLAGKRQKEPGFWDVFGQSFANQAGQTLGGGAFGGGGGGGGGFSNPFAAQQAGSIGSTGSFPMVF